MYVQVYCTCLGRNLVIKYLLVVTTSEQSHARPELPQKISQIYIYDSKLCLFCEHHLNIVLIGLQL